MESIVKNIPNTIAYLDDILITGDSIDAHMMSLNLVLAKLEEMGLRLKKEKCIFFTDHVDYLGLQTGF